MKILAIEKAIAGVTEAQFTPEILKAEALKVWELQQRGFIREIYFRADETSAIVILECQDLDEAGSIIQQLPLVKEKLIDFEFIPLKPYPGLARLFVHDIPLSRT